ncbi:MAG: CRISPR-associated endoribonuclease Cas6 [Bacteroidetes bacterium]|nr:MAG: CRISPR-associated endoribonuclease Cas6 [Bacteroidota bacterium]
MRIFISLTSNNQLVPFNYQQFITGAIHKWLGENIWHNQTSLYSFSLLIGGQQKGNKLLFPQSTGFFFSAFDSKMIKDLIRGIQVDPYINFGLTVNEIQVRETPVFGNKHVFLVQSPVLVKRKIDGREVHFTYDQTETDILLTETLGTKLEKAGLSKDGINVRFDKGYIGAKTKVIYYNNIGNKANICPIIIEGSQEQLEFAWNVGVGNSTGIGFGMLK